MESTALASFVNRLSSVYYFFMRNQIQLLLRSEQNVWYIKHWSQSYERWQDHLQVLIQTLSKRHQPTHTGNLINWIINPKNALVSTHIRHVRRLDEISWLVSANCSLYRDTIVIYSLKISRCYSITRVISRMSIKDLPGVYILWCNPSAD